MFLIIKKVSNNPCVSSILPSMGRQTMTIWNSIGMKSLLFLTNSFIQKINYADTCKKFSGQPESSCHAFFCRRLFPSPVFVCMLACLHPVQCLQCNALTILQWFFRARAKRGAQGRSEERESKGEEGVTRATGRWGEREDEMRRRGGEQQMRRRSG